MNNPSWIAYTPMDITLERVVGGFSKIEEVRLRAKSTKTHQSITGVGQFMGGKITIIIEFDESNALSEKETK